jgi:hypothetical protein
MMTYISAISRPCDLKFGMYGEAIFYFYILSRSELDPLYFFIVYAGFWIQTGLIPLLCGGSFLTARRRHSENLNEKLKFAGALNCAPAA